MNLMLVGEADNHQRFLAGYLCLQDGMHVTGLASNRIEALYTARRLHPDIVIIDVDTTEKSGSPDAMRDCTNLAMEILGQSLSPAVILMTVHDHAIAARNAAVGGIYAVVGKDDGVDALICTLNELYLFAHNGEQS